MSRPINLFSEINHYLQTFTKTDDIKKLSKLMISTDTLTVQQYTIMEIKSF